MTECASSGLKVGTLTVNVYCVGSPSYARCDGNSGYVGKQRSISLRDMEGLWPPSPYKLQSLSSVVVAAPWC